jgi:hypothetical protein
MTVCLDYAGMNHSVPLHRGSNLIGLDNAYPTYIQRRYFVFRVDLVACWQHHAGVKTTADRRPVKFHTVYDAQLAFYDLHDLTTITNGRCGIFILFHN